MSKNLIIVESPAKAVTIKKYLGPDYDVAASYGHVRDLPKKGMSIDIEHGFEPTYQVSDDKKKTIANLKKRVKLADFVWLAADPDREGEAIAWHLFEALKLNPKTTKRIVFREMTEPGIKRGIAEPRDVDRHLVEAQQARRVLDRLVGYELSPVLWRKVRPGLSAGRVQSVAVRVIVEREREITEFTSLADYRVRGIFDVEGKNLATELTSRLKTEEAATDLLNRITSSTFSVEKLEAKPGKRTPAAPFTTSTLQQEASRKLGFSVRQTMSVAQRLYESGSITYMRTDSTNLSETALSGASAAITKSFGEKYAKRRTFATKSAAAQEAHEAIRPTDFGASEVGGERNQQRLYQLIWQRAIASQMADAILEKTVVTVAPSDQPERFRAQAETIQFDGFLKVYIEGRDDDDDDEENLLPPLTTGQALVRDKITARQTFGRPKPRYTEASLVKRLEELGIGRPSTYAPTISTIQDRGYVEKGDLEGVNREYIELTLKNDIVDRKISTEVTGADRNKLMPTDVGEIVNDFLVENVPQIVDFNFTADAELDFDRIAENQTSWNDFISQFYSWFHPIIAALIAAPVEAGGQESGGKAGTRLLGPEPKNGINVYAKLAKFGPVVQMGEVTDEEKPKFAPIPAGLSLKTITLEQALPLFNLPRTLGTLEDGTDIIANNGPYGPYVKAGSTNASIKPEDPLTITLERATEIIMEKREAAANMTIAAFDDGVKILNGRYGPYITNGKKNAKIPKDSEPSSIDHATALALLEAAPVKKARRPTRGR